MESIANELLQATEALAGTEPLPHGSGGKQPFAYYCPVVVTTARLWVTKLDPETVSLDGTADPSTDFTQVEWVDFTKNLWSSKADTGGASLARWNKQSNRTVIVVNAQHFVELLESTGTPGLRP